MNENLAIDDNGRNGLGALTNDANLYIKNLRVNPITGRLLVDAHVTSSNTNIGDTVLGGTAGSVLFLDAGSTLAQDNSHFFYDVVHHRLGLGTTTPSATLDIEGTLKFVDGSQAANYVLISDGSGNATWTNLATNSSFITNLVSNNTFTTNLANNSNFYTTLATNNTFVTNLASNTTFVNSITTIVTTGGGVLFQTNSVTNGSQAKLNLVAGTGVSLTDNGSGSVTIANTAGIGTVTSVSVVSANGLAGTVATATTTPAITLRATPTGILQSNGTTISAIVVGSGLSFSAGTLTATGSGGTVTSIATSGSVTGGTITTTGTVSLVNDNATPGNSKYYGTNSGGTKGFFSLPTSSTTFYQQQVPMGTGVNASGVSLSSVITGIVSGGDFYVAQGAFTGGSGVVANLNKVTMDSNTNGFYISVTITTGSPFNQAHVVVIGSFVYISGFTSNSFGVAVLYRYNIGTLASETAMTVGAGGTGFGGNGCFTDGTFFYSITGTNTVDKYSISGTNLTWVSTITFTGITNAVGDNAWSDGTTVYQGTKKWAITGGSSTTVTNPSARNLIGLNSNTIMYNFSFTYLHATGVDLAYLLANPISYQ